MFCIAFIVHIDNLCDESICTLHEICSSFIKVQHQVSEDKWTALLAGVWSPNRNRQQTKQRWKEHQIDS